MQSREDSFWESFPRTLQSRKGAGRYINAFQALSQELSPLSRQEVPPPPGISIWDMFPWKAPIPQQPVTSPSYRMRGEWLKAALERRALVPQVPEVAPAICQPLPHPGADQQTHTSRWCSCQVRLQSKSHL